MRRRAGEAQGTRSSPPRIAPKAAPSCAGARRTRIRAALECIVQMDGWTAGPTFHGSAPDPGGPSTR